jgi:ABC-2 type transport system ATP-binding protein
MNNVSPSANDIAIDVEGLTKSFSGRTVVQNLSMQVKRGSIYGFLGPNGSGKTTTIRMLCGLLTPDSGRGTCLGYDIRRDADKIKRRVGYMTQRFSLYQDLSVRENLEFVARLYGLPDAKAAAREMIKRLGLSGREEQLAGELSGGWKQRLALGAWTSRPPASIPRRGAISGTRFMRLPPTASPCWSRPITWTRPSAVTRSPISLMVICWRTAPSMR